MKRLLLALLLVPPLQAFAQERAPSADPMAGWVPPVVKHEARDKQEIEALIRTMDAAMKKGDLAAAVALVDFPVLMITDDSKGEAMADAWTRERWVEVMRPFYENPMKDAQVTHRPKVFLLSDSLASVDDVVTMKAGGKSVTSRNSMFLVRRGGEWRVKAMAEGGWGDMMAASHQAAQGTQGPGSQGTGSAGEGTQTREPPSGAGTGSGPPAMEPPKSQGSGAERPERTTR